MHLPKSPPAYAPYSGDQYTAGCDNSADMWAVSQAAPMRRVILNGSVVLQDYCSPQGYVSGGFFADDEFNGGTVGNDGQQQFFTRNSNIDSWSNGVWNQVFLGDNGAPATSFGPGSHQYTTLPSTPIYASQAFQSPDRAGVQWNDLLTVFLDAVHGSGGITSVINGVGGPSTAVNVSQPSM